MSEVMCLSGCLKDLKSEKGCFMVNVRVSSILLRMDYAFEVDIVEGQKTGYFFDQRENRASIASLMTGWGIRSGIKLKERSLDENQGSERAPVNANGKVVTFPIGTGQLFWNYSHILGASRCILRCWAKKVTCLDVSAHAIETAERNVARQWFH